MGPGVAGVVSCLAANAGVLPASKSPARVQPHGQSVPPTEGFARSDRNARSVEMERGNAVKGTWNTGAAQLRICRESPLTEWSATLARREETAARFPLPHGECRGLVRRAAPPTRGGFWGCRPAAFFQKGRRGLGTGAATGQGNAPGKEGCDPTRSTPKRAEGSPQEHTSLRSKG